MLTVGQQIQCNDCQIEITKVNDFEVWYKFVGEWYHFPVAKDIIMSKLSSGEYKTISQ